MPERRVEARFLCAELVQVSWRDKSGGRRECTAVLEDISPSGACLQFEHAVPVETRIEVRHSKGALEGEVKYCVFQEIGYFVGLRFTPAHPWSSSDFVPDHLLDVRPLPGNKKKPN